MSHTDALEDKKYIVSIVLDFLDLFNIYNPIRNVV